LKRLSSTILLTLLLTSMLGMALNIQPAEADYVWTETIYIRADGGIEPADAPISTVDNITYTLTDNIVGAASSPYDIAVIIERDNIILDGAGYTLRGADVQLASTGISLEGRSNVTVRNINIRNFLSRGIYISESSNVTVSGNYINIKYGPGVSISGNFNTVSGNTITNNGEGLIISGNFNTISGNTIKANSGDGLIIGGDFNTVSGNTITNNGKGLIVGCGVRLSGGSNNTVSGNNIANNGDGIDFQYSSNNIIYHNNFIDNTRQVHISATGYANVWDDGYPSGGNYWSDYNGTDIHSGPYQNETGSDGIGDAAYAIDTNNIDRYPLMNPWGASEVQVGVKADDWIKIEYTISRWTSGQPRPEWLKVEFLSVEGTKITIRVTMRMSDGTEQSDTVPVDVVAGGQALGLSGFVIPANLTVGDSVYISGYGNVTLAGETTRTYAGTSRTVVYTSFSQYGTQLTYYWDKQTGVMVEASTTSGGVTATAKATETNMWEAAPPAPFWMEWWLWAIVAVVIVALAGVYFLKKRKPPTPPAPTPPTENS